MATAEHISSVFGAGKSLYDMLGVEPEATASTIKKAYFKLALKCHPDKCPGDEGAHARFQALSMVHSVLSNPESRELYDETGELAEEEGDGAGGQEADFDIWCDYWRTMFPKITKKDIDNFAGKYQGSDEEKADVLAAYVSSKGAMDVILDSVMLAGEDDRERFAEVVDAAVAAGEAKEFPAWRKMKKMMEKGGGAKGKGGVDKAAALRKAKAAKEAEEAKELEAMIMARQEARGGAGGGALATLRARQFDDLVSDLAARYAKPKPKKPKAPKAGSKASDTNKGKAKKNNTDNKGKKAGPKKERRASRTPEEENRAQDSESLNESDSDDDGDDDEEEEEAGGRGGNGRAGPRGGRGSGGGKRARPRPAQEDVSDADFERVQREMMEQRRRRRA